MTSSGDAVLVKYIAEITKSDLVSVQKDSFYFVGLLAGSVMGATQSTSRSMMSKLTPPDRKTEFFGFFSFFGKSSAILGPLVFGLVSFSTGSQRAAILSIGAFFVVGLWILTMVKDPKTDPKII